MNRKLLILNLALVGLAVAAGIQLRSRWVANHTRTAAELGKRVPPVPAPPFTPALAPAAVLPSNYIRVAQQDLFDASRNPDVPVEIPPAPPPPPPPPPMPPLPVYHGAMNIGDGPVAIMSVGAGGRHQGVKPGETIGPFKLVDITRDDLTLEWNGQLIRKELWELQNRSLPTEQASNTGRTEAPPPPVRVETPTEKGPGAVTQFGSAPCQPNDSSPIGTVRDGMVKKAVPTPFGNACLWDPVGK